MEKYHPPRYQRKEQLRIEPLLWEIINGITGAAAPKKDWKPERMITCNLQLEMDLKPNSTDEDAQSGMVAPAMEWTKYTGCKSIQYIKMCHAPNVKALEDWDVVEAVRRAVQKLSTDLEFLMKETTDDENYIEDACLPGKAPIRADSGDHENI